MLVSLTGGLEPTIEEPAVTHELEVETAIAKGGNALSLGIMDLGPITPYTCPECHGVLISLKEGGTPRFRCGQTGHAYSLNSLLFEVTSYIENSLWNTTRAFEEGILLMQHASRHTCSRKVTGRGPALCEQGQEHRSPSPDPPWRARRA